MAVSCTEFALVSGDVGHPPYDVARQKLYFFIMEPTLSGAELLEEGANTHQKNETDTHARLDPEVSGRTDDHTLTPE
jgi:hypothetical protein